MGRQRISVAYVPLEDQAYKELEKAMRESQEELDRINEVIGCLDELEISTGQAHRPELNLD